MAINDIFVGKDNNKYRQVGEDQYVLVQETEQTTEEKELSDDTPTGEQIAKGLVAEIGIATTGQALATLTGPLYPVVACGSGVIGSLTAQNYEDREDYSVGRSLAAGFYNLIPGSKAVKVANQAAKAAGKTLTTGENIAIAAKAEAMAVIVEGISI